MSGAVPGREVPERGAPVGGAASGEGTDAESAGTGDQGGGGAGNAGGDTTATVTGFGTGAGTGTGAAARPRRFRSSPRARVLLAAAAVVALTVPTTIVVGKLSGTDDRPLSHAPVVDGVENDRAAEEGERTTASPGTPSASATSGATRTPSPTASDRARGAHGAGAGAGAGHGSGGGDRATGGVPLTATISSYNWEAPCDEFYVLDQEPEDVPPPPGPTDGRSWARALGAVDGAHQLIEVTVQGTSRQPVVLHSLRVRPVTKKAPLPWSVYSTSLGCGSGITPQSFDIDLDDDRPRTRPVPGQQGDTVVPAKDFPFQVTSTDVEVFDLNVHVEGHEVSWYLELEWSSGGRSGTLRIDDGGKPFRVSATKTRPQYSYWYDKARWMAD